MNNVPNPVPADNRVLAALADRYRKDPCRAAWFAIGAARQALSAGQPARARQVLDHLVALDSTPVQPSSKLDEGLEPQVLDAVVALDSTPGGEVK